VSPLLHRFSSKVEEGLASFRGRCEWVTFKINLQALVIV
jgi:hypothetical protein